MAPGSDFVDEITPVIGMLERGGAAEQRACVVVLSGPRIGEIFAIDEAAGDEGFLIGRDPRADLPLLEDGVSRRHARIVHVRSGSGSGGGTVDDGLGAGVNTGINTDGTASEDWLRVVDLDSTNGTWVDGVRVDSAALRDGDKIRIGQTTVLRVARYDLLEEECQRQLLESALRDSLTRLFNRRYFLERLSAETSHAQRHRRPLALLMIDLDHFKEVNDRHGHLVGDQVLRQVTAALTPLMRQGDVLARWGGDELVVLTRDTTVEDALALAERLRLVVAAIACEAHGEPVPVRISVGVAGLGRDEAVPAVSAIALVERADQALYRAKNGGRDRVSA